MTTPAWFQWISPLPTDEAEVRALVLGFEGLVEEVKTFPVALDLPPRARQMKAQAKLLSSIVKALERTPSNQRGGHFYECRDDLARRAARLEMLAKRILPVPKRGHPDDVPKRQAWIETYLFLAERGLVATTTRAGMVAGMAQAVWLEATGETNSVDAWFQLGKRGFPGLQKADTNEFSDPIYIPGEPKEKA